MVYIPVLLSSMVAGLLGGPADLKGRIEVFGSNVIPPKPPKSFFRLCWEAAQDTTLIILMVAAIISLGLSFYKPPPKGQQDFASNLYSPYIDFNFVTMGSQTTTNDEKNQFD